MLALDLATASFVASSQFFVASCYYYVFQLSYSHGYLQQESCAIAKMTAQCALYIGALKIFGTP